MVWHVLGVCGIKICSWYAGKELLLCTAAEEQAQGEGRAGAAVEATLVISSVVPHVQLLCTANNVSTWCESMTIFQGQLVNRPGEWP